MFARKYQQRLPYDLLSGLANSLLDGTVFKIVTGLQEVQEWEERGMSQQRTKMIADHKSEALMDLYTRMASFFMTSFSFFAGYV